MGAVGAVAAIPPERPAGRRRHLLLLHTEVALRCGEDEEEEGPLVGRHRGDQPLQGAPRHLLPHGDHDGLAGARERHPHLRRLQDGPHPGDPHQSGHLPPAVPLLLRRVRRPAAQPPLVQADGGGGGAPRRGAASVRAASGGARGPGAAPDLHVQGEAAAASDRAGHAVVPRPAGGFHHESGGILTGEAPPGPDRGRRDVADGRRIRRREDPLGAAEGRHEEEGEDDGGSIGAALRHRVPSLPLEGSPIETEDHRLVGGLPEDPLRLPLRGSFEPASRRPDRGEEARGGAPRAAEPLRGLLRRAEEDPLPQEAPRAVAQVLQGLRAPPPRLLPPAEEQHLHRGAQGTLLRDRGGIRDRAAPSPRSEEEVRRADDRIGAHPEGSAAERTTAGGSRRSSKGNPRAELNPKGSIKSPPPSLINSIRETYSMHNLNRHSQNTRASEEFNLHRMEKIIREMR